MGRAKSADNNVLFRSHIYIPVQSDHPNLSLTENGSDIHKVQRCKECIFWHFCGTGLFWTPHGQVFFNSPANTVGSGIYSATLQLLRLSALSCIDVVVPSATAAPYYSRSKAK